MALPQRRGSERVCARTRSRYDSASIELSCCNSRGLNWLLLKFNLFFLVWKWGHKIGTAVQESVSSPLKLWAVTLWLPVQYLRVSFHHDHKWRYHWSMVFTSKVEYLAFLSLMVIVQISSQNFNYFYHQVFVGISHDYVDPSCWFIQLRRSILNIFQWLAKNASTWLYAQTRLLGLYKESNLLVGGGENHVKKRQRQ